ncbi:hypothetical protein CU044_5973 [Streptomyces sp. L-9-10]|uniref:hypothetical protein n=1 Tax=Streptomyces sp. L-9-10 TaxID=1478131 RepID=UPI0010E183F2|nr:hypothetical protein CU044_5973 [Streptomyces sp. L-9-10]
MDRLLAGTIPPGGGCDLKTLAAEAGVTRTGFYPKGERPGPYQHLAEEFERRVKEARATGKVTDPKVSQIERLKAQVAELKERLTERDADLAELTAFKTLAISRLAAQRQEIEQLREQAAAVDNVRHLPAARPGSAPFGSCS